MKEYTIQLSKPAKKALDKLSENVAEPIIEAIADLAFNPRPIGYIKLKERSGYRIRVGDYRIIYEIIDKILLVDIIDVGHRSDIYKPKS